MILVADCTVGVTALGDRQVIALNARLGGEPVRAIEILGSICVRVDAEGRVVGVYVTGAVPEGTRVTPGPIPLAAAAP